MKKIASYIFAFVLILSLISCSDVYDEVIITDLKEYDSVWSLPERSAHETSFLFPGNVKEEQCILFFCKHTTYFPLGTGWQLVLEIEYDNLEFLEEITRLKKLCAESSIRDFSEYFDGPVYVTVWNWDSCFEYAMVDEEKRTVSYVYLDCIPKEDLVIDEKYVFKGYERKLPDANSYSIYLPHNEGDAH